MRLLTKIRRSQELQVLTGRVKSAISPRSQNTARSRAEYESISTPCKQLPGCLCRHPSFSKFSQVRALQRWVASQGQDGLSSISLLLFRTVLF